MHEEATLALLFWHLDGTDSEFAQINCKRGDALRLARSMEFEMGETRRKELTDIGRAMLVAYRAGQMDGPSKNTEG
jgi:hypothetical protein